MNERAHRSAGANTLSANTPGANTLSANTPGANTPGLSSVLKAVTVVAVLAVTSLFLLLSGCQPTRVLPAASESDLESYRQGIAEINAEIRFIAGPFQDVRDAYRSSSGMLYVLDSGRNLMIRFQSDGVRLDSLGGTGSGRMQLNGAVMVDATNDLKIYISDAGNRRIQLFDRRLQYLGTVSPTDRSGRPVAYHPGSIVSLLSGDLLMWDQDQQRLRKVLPNGTIDDTFALRGVSPPVNPVGVVVGQNEIVLLSTSGQLLRYSVFGQYQGFIQLPAGAMGIAALDQGFGILYASGVLLLDGRRQPSGWIKLHEPPCEFRSIHKDTDGVLLSCSTAVYGLKLS